ncbi:hypothetical protein H5P28_14975 [Ruficoccus amylovorans]|uniref:Uncharacterized protein n=1 Tax=Ruficoccus amylovorans TaxID=1804625 RepID=A0A842HHU5_9BACT|nr:hypothetical protein [Ruficoccus amylovorans]MBC2595568.1 hypothetical protein [Ruficoccus amylovorans]
MKTATLTNDAALPLGESNPDRHKEFSRLAGDVIKDALSLIHLPNYPESYVEDRLKRRAAMVLALLSTSEHVADEDFQEYAEEMLTMTIFSEIMELQA